MLIRIEFEMLQAYEDFEFPQEGKNAGNQGSDSFSFSIWVVEKLAHVS